MELDEARIAEIVGRVLDRVLPREAAGPYCAPPPPRHAPGGRAALPSPPGPAVHAGPRLRGVFDDLDRAVDAAHVAHAALEGGTLELRGRIIAAMRAAGRAELETISRMAVEETGLGRVEDKRKKNALVIEKTPGLEILRPVAVSGDDGLMITERAPYGVIGAITPTTNPTETIICNAIGMVAGGNAVVFNVHPGARRVSNHLVDRLNEAMVAAGGPANLVTSMAEPTIESAQALMRHPGIRLLVVTGGPAVVREAMRSGKRTIAAGPGNPPVVVDETADLARAAQGVVDGGSLDNCIVCTAEKEVIAVAAIADELKRGILARGGVEVRGREAEALLRLVVAEDGLHPNKAWVGKDAAKILAAIGVRAPEETRVVIVECDEASPFVQAELLMPVLGFVRVPAVEDAIAMARRVEHGFGHTAAMYSRDVERLGAMARTINTSIFTKNAPTFAGLGLGGEGYTSFTIASPTGEGLTNATHFTRERRCTLTGSFRIV